MSYKEINYKDLQINPASFFADNWAILSAGTADNCNSMIVSWGTVGTLWGKSVAVAFVRPQRYTDVFMADNDTFSLSFYTPSDHEKIAPFGSKSGRDCDKYDLTGINAVSVGDTTVCTSGAETVLVCRKLYTDEIKPEFFTDKELDGKWYPNKDYHKVYVGEIIGCYAEEK